MPFFEILVIFELMGILEILVGKNGNFLNSESRQFFKFYSKKRNFFLNFAKFLNFVDFQTYGNF